MILQKFSQKKKMCGRVDLPRNISPPELLVRFEKKNSKSKNYFQVTKIVFVLIYYESISVHCFIIYTQYHCFILYTQVQLHRIIILFYEKCLGGAAVNTSARGSKGPGFDPRRCTHESFFGIFHVLGVRCTKMSIILAQGPVVAGPSGSDST